MASLREVGQRLKAERESQGLTLKDVSTRTRVTVRHLLALEEGNESDLPETFYIRGFLKMYAEVVGFSPADIADAYKQAPAPVMAAPRRSSLLGPIVYYGALLVFFGGVIALAWWFQPRVSVVDAPVATPSAASTATPSPKPLVGPPTAMPSHPAPSPSPSPSPSPVPSATPLATSVPVVVPSEAPTQSPTPLPTESPVPSVSPDPSASPPANTRTVAVGLTLVERSWVEIIVDGKRIYEGVLAKGTKRAHKGHTIEVSAGNSGGVKLSVDGQDIGLMGTHGEVATRQFKPK